MKTNIIFTALGFITILVLGLSAILFIAWGSAGETSYISSHQLLSLLAKENDVVRQLYTAEIVGKGKTQGLAFDEDWRKTEVEAGPLPALFLRETASYLFNQPAQLELFLGSAFPINQSNSFRGIQAEMFSVMESSGEAQFFFDEDLETYGAMFPDIASAEPCVSCHNEHPESRKTNWQRGDLMGATTWSYPRETVSLSEALALLQVLRDSFQYSYSLYLEEVESFSDVKPEIGERWPKDGFYLPSAEVFMAEAIKRSSTHTLNMFIDTMNADNDEF